jgi:hypothetical protein
LTSVDGWLKFRPCGSVGACSGFGGGTALLALFALATESWKATLFATVLLKYTLLFLPLMPNFAPSSRAKLSVAITIFLLTAAYVFTDADSIVSYVRSKVPERYDKLRESLVTNVRGVLYGAIYSTLLTQALKTLVIFLMNLVFGVPLAAVLAILGYSVNESVVVFDRIRENFRKMRRASVHTVIDNAITRTMSRTVITHFCTQLMVTSMLVFGGETLHYFALALTIGILFGIYSSVLVASPIVMWLGVSREDLVKVEKKTAVETP